MSCYILYLKQNIMLLKKFYKKIFSDRWELGIVENTLENILEGEPLNVKWIINKDKSHWYADPFILDVTDDEIILLVEDMPTFPHKGVISKLVVSKNTMEIIDKKVVLELPTHLSFPAILREKGNVYVYPENAHDNVLKIYKFIDDELISPVILSNDQIWDSVITDLFGQRLLFTARNNDYYLDIYRWNCDTDMFEFLQSIKSENKNSRMAGQLFVVNGKIYCPCQDCSQRYGGALIIKEVNFDGMTFSFTPVRRLTSTHPTLKEGLHTINSYKDIVVIDVYGYNYPKIASFFNLLKKIIWKTKYGKYIFRSKKA